MSLPCRVTFRKGEETMYVGGGNLGLGLDSETVEVARAVDMALFEWKWLIEKSPHVLVEAGYSSDADDFDNVVIFGTVYERKPGSHGGGSLVFKAKGGVEPRLAC